MSAMRAGSRRKRRAGSALSGEDMVTFRAKVCVRRGASVHRFANHGAIDELLHIDDLVVLQAIQVRE